VKVLLIGGTRFLGAAIARELRRRGHEVSVFHRGRTETPLPGDVRHVFGDAREPGAVEAVLQTDRFDAVVDTILQSADLERLLPHFARYAGQLVHCGSTGVYAPAGALPCREDDPTPCPVELGGFGEKLRQDELILEFHRRTGFKTCSLRPSNIFGAGDVPLDIWGARDPGYFVGVAAGRPITVPNDGRALLQPVHVADLAPAFCQALESDKAAGQVYNVSSDRAVTLTRYAELTRELLGSSSPIEYAPMESLLATGKANESGLRFICEHMCIDSGKAARDLGYRPRYGVREGLRDSLEWMAGRGLLAGEVRA
jgi:nucleoside-diphosphate-sugar epimerase